MLEDSSEFNYGGFSRDSKDKQVHYTALGSMQNEQDVWGLADWK